jgi:hypothetical protein
MRLTALWYVWEGDSKGAYKNLLGRPEGKRPLGRPRRGWEDTIKINLQEVGWEAMGLIDLAQGRAVGGLL